MFIFYMAGKWRPPISLFVLLMILVTAIQGTYLGYMIGVLTSLERRFGISSERSGLLLSCYDIGHTVAILVVGYFGVHSHLPRITGIGVVLSALSMVLLALPAALFGSVSHETDVYIKHKFSLFPVVVSLCWAIRQQEIHHILDVYAEEYRCDPYRLVFDEESHCTKEHDEHTIAYVLLAVGQVLAGIFAAPFNTVAYVYIDTNVEDRSRSPLYLGLLTATYAFGPALGFSLSALVSQLFAYLPETHVSMGDDHWLGAWWLGFAVCALVYLFAAIPFFFFPKTYRKDIQERHALRSANSVPLPERNNSVMEKLKHSSIEFLHVSWALIRNPVFVCMVFSWMFASYMVGAYQTFLPKYLETQFSIGAGAADFATGTIAVGAIAAPTALGGLLLSRWPIPPRRAILYLALGWTIIVITYLGAMQIGCDQPPIEGLQYTPYNNKWIFDENHYTCAEDCGCSAVVSYDGVSFDGMNFFSPCHAGCTNYDPQYDIWSDCSCAMHGSVQRGISHNSCTWQVWVYLAVMMFGLFFGNIFFMVTMMIVLRSVYDDEKVTALSFASCVTNMFGFIPAPVIFGWIVDSACILWHSKCPGDRGNCVVYENDRLRFDFHMGNAVLQALAVVMALVCYIVSRTRKLPEEESYDDYEMEMTAR